MTDHADTPTTAPEPQQGTPYTREQLELAQVDERLGELEATNTHLRNRCVTLNLELRLRDERAALQAQLINDLQVQLAELQEGGDDATASRVDAVT